MKPTRTTRALAMTAVVGMALITGCSSSSQSADRSSNQRSTATERPSATVTSPSPEKSQATKPTATPSTSGPKPSVPATPAPPVTTKAKNQTPVLNSLPGKASSGCLAVGTNRDLRSGSIAAGNFVDARKKYASEANSKEQPEVFLYVIPQHSKGLKKATALVKPRGGGKTFTVTSKSVEQADVYSYFAFNIPIPASGKYELTMSSGKDTGCFVVSFARS